MNREKILSTLGKFVPVEVRADLSGLSKRSRQILRVLLNAVEITDEIFLQQSFSRNPEIRKNLTEAGNAEELEFFDLMAGPFDRLNHDECLIGHYTKPAGAGFYPDELTRDEAEAYIQGAPALRLPDIISPYSVIIRNEKGHLEPVMYSCRYRLLIYKLSDILKQAAHYAEAGTLKSFLNHRADDLLSDNYENSEIAWVLCDDDELEIVAGPYEVYEDGLLNMKTSFELFLTIKDREETHKLMMFEGMLEELEKSLPLAPELRDFSRNKISKILVVNQVANAGDAKAGIQTLAFNLPNDEKVREKYGSKNVLMKNIHHAKFDKLLKEIAAKVLSEKDMANLTFEAFFNHTLLHEMSHGMGPGLITKDGKKGEVKSWLKETYSTIEECKADSMGLFHNIALSRAGIHGISEKQFIATFTAGLLRSVRFGINEAHGGGNAIIFNCLVKNEALKLVNNVIQINYEFYPDVVSKLLERILTIQAKGDYEAARELIEEFRFMSDELKVLVEKLKVLPVDIRPIFVTAEELKRDKKLNSH